MKKRYVSTVLLSMSLLFSTPAFAAKGEVADEANWDVAPAPSNYNPALKEKLDKQGKTNGAPTLASNPVIVIDPGHGGSDSGAVGNGLQEKNLTLDIATRAKNYVVANYPATVYMTRSSDATVSLEDRASYANSVGASFFVSMHINSATATSANGLETYNYYGSINGAQLATSAYNKLKTSYSSLRGVKEAGFYVLKYTNMPAMLGETGFISNSTDAANLGSASFRQNLAAQYAQGMHEYWWGF
ncbi:N-acetylmuramoyl-L-alanine amidase [Priestia koreensis]|uniref:N-acetylmuramoyl-L-alanine amidase n=1 Tax=Priestia koreensis TaxID=284581 RepID=UPI00301641A9